MADLSNLSNMAAREQGVKVIKERQIPSPIDILMKMQSSGNLPDFVSGIVKDFIDKENSSIQAPVVQKSVIESRLIILAKICLFVMLLVKIQFGRLKPKL